MEALPFQSKEWLYHWQLARNVVEGVNSTIKLSHTESFESGDTRRFLDRRKNWLVGSLQLMSSNIRRIHTQTYEQSDFWSDAA